MTNKPGICWRLAYFLQRSATSCLLGLIAAMVFYWIYSLGLDTGQNKIASFRYRDIYFAIALSHLVPGHPKDYTAYPEASVLAKEISSGRFTLQQIIEKLKTEVAKNRSVSGVIHPEEDMGTTDFVKLAFQLFGFQTESLYLMFFIVLGIPILTSFLCFFRNPVRLTLLIFFLLGLYSITFIMGDYDPVNIAGLHEPRFFSVVSFIPLIHILLITSDAEKTIPLSLKTFTGLTIQIIAILFAYHTRSDAIWQILCFYSSILFFYLLADKQVRNTKKFMLHLILPTILMTLGMIGLNTYVKSAYNQTFFDNNTGRHTFWHAMLAGFTVHPDLNRKYQLGGSDQSIYELAERARGKPCESEQCLEQEKKDLYTNILRTYPRKYLETYLFYQPRFWLQKLMSINNQPTIMNQGLTYNPFRIEILILIAIITVMQAYKNIRGEWLRIFLVCGFATAFSFIPPFIVGSAVHIAALTYVTSSMFIYTLALTGFAWLYNLFSRRQISNIFSNFP